MATQSIPSTPTADDADIDPETIQSTVDMSLSLALSLVQSWMPPVSSKPLDPSIVQSRKRVEESMRRPPRLGVGAPTPTAQNNQPTHHETQRLKNRLVGSGAARRKAEEETKLNGGPHPSGSKRHNDASDDEDESESRASAMKKKTKGINGLSVFGTGTKGTKSNAGSEANAGPRPATVTEMSPDTSEPTTAPAPPAPPAAESYPVPSSTQKLDPTTDESKPDTVADGAEYSSQTQPVPNEPMGIHKLPPKLPLSAKIWPHSVSPPISDSSHHKRRKTAPMLPPPSPVVETWSMQLPKLPPSSSRSGSVTSSSVPSSSAAVEPRLDSTARLSRKERKRLRKAAQQSAASQEVKQEGGTDRDSERSDVRAPMPLDADSNTQGVKGSSSQGVKGVSAHRIDEPDTDASDSDEESEVVSQIVDEKMVTQNDTVRDGGKKKRKRRARKKSGPG